MAKLMGFSECMGTVPKFRWLFERSIVRLGGKVKARRL